MSAHPASHRRGWLSALVAQVTDYVFEEAEATVAPEPAALEPHAVVAVVAAAPRSGATTVARLLAAELAARGDGAAVVVGSAGARRAAPQSRTAVRVATALTGAAAAQPLGRLCIARPAGAHERDRVGLPHEAVSALAAAARYLAPVVVDLPADGSAARIAAVADRIVVVAAAIAEPALLEAVAAVIGGGPVKVVNRIGEQPGWTGRADIQLPESRLAARAAALGTRALGPLGAGIAVLADALELPR